MAIVNRDKDSSEQIYTVQLKHNAVVAVGATLYAGSVPSPGQLLETKLAGWGLSSVPSYSVQIHRWTSAGSTVIGVGSGLTLAVAFGVSGGMVGETYAANGSLTALQAGDVLVLKSAGANTAASALVADFVIKATQDIKKTHDIS